MDYELVPDQTLQEFIKEIKELKDNIKNLKSYLGGKENEGKGEKNEIKNLDKEISSQKSETSNIYKDIIESLIKSNLELQAKISELIVLDSEVIKGIKELLNIFKEAAIRSMYEKKGGKGEKEYEDLNERLELLEKTNSKILELIEKLNENLQTPSNVQTKPSYTFK